MYLNMFWLCIRTIRKLIFKELDSHIGMNMRICPQCESENEDKYIFCINCHKPLPKQSHLESLMTMAVHELQKSNFRKAMTYLDQILKLNIGDKDAWFLKGITMSNLGAGKEARTCFKSAGVRLREKTCQPCLGSGKCMSCGQSGVCYMCKGRHKCAMCGGSGTCHNCDGAGCKMCKDTGKCIRCKGTCECVYCSGSGICPDCHGLRSCGFCGGTGRALEIQVESVPVSVRKFLKLKK